MNDNLKNEQILIEDFMNAIFKTHAINSWNIIMDIVEKIETLIIKDEYHYYDNGFSVIIQNKYCCIKCHSSKRQDGVIYQTPYLFKPSSKKEAVYLGIIEFINWYNTQIKLYEKTTYTT